MVTDRTPDRDETLRMAESSRNNAKARNPKKTNPGMASRLAASEIIADVLFEASYLDDAFVAAVARYKLDHRDRALVRAISATTLRRLGQVRQALALHMKKPLAPKFSAASSILYTATAQILFMDLPDHAVIDLAVGQMRMQRKLHHLSGMANAVLRKVSAGKDELQRVDSLEAGRINTPKWLWQLWAKDYGKEIADRIANGHLREAALDISTKGASIPPQAQELPTGGFRLEAGYGRVEDLPGYTQGEWWVQDFAASLPVKILGDVVGKNVADLCAAPGGKTMQLAAAHANVTAVDVSDHRLARVRENLERVGLNAEIICSDALAWQPEKPLDAVLLDAPCSATGTIRRHPDALYLKKSSDIDALCKLQKNMLVAAADMVKPGGLILYCTCSLQKREGEQQVETFLAAYDEFRRMPVSAEEIGGLGHLINANGDVRTLPFYEVGGSVGMDGFFISRLVRS